MQTGHKRTLKPPTRNRISPRRRKVLWLRAAGWSYQMIADKLGISENVVRKDLLELNHTLLPGLTDGDEPAKGYRLVYALGLLDAGVPAEDVPHYLAALVTKVNWLLDQEARTGPDSGNPDHLDMAQ